MDTVWVLFCIRQFSSYKNLSTISAPAFMESIEDSRLKYISAARPSFGGQSTVVMSAGPSGKTGRATKSPGIVVIYSSQLPFTKPGSSSCVTGSPGDSRHKPNTHSPPYPRLSFGSCFVHLKQKELDQLDFQDPQNFLFWSVGLNFGNSIK